MRHRPSPLVLVLAAAVALVAAGCSGGGEDAGGSVDGEGDVAAGRTLYQANCVACHGELGVGTAAGPPLVHELYVPTHHADESFLVAVQRGVAPHHWDFGAMPAIAGLDADDVADIVAYVRSLQREAGLLE